MTFHGNRIINLSMKRYIFILVSALVVMACSDGLDEPRLIQAGDAIRFTATTVADTRTIYGDKNAEGNYPVYWEDGDKVKIFCPQADATGVQEAEFTVSNPGEASTTYALSGMNEMVWGVGDGEKGTHDFYMFYPSTQLVSFANESTNGRLEFDLPAEQVVTMTQNGTAWEGINTDYALMAGHMAINRTETSDTDVINLQFKPITTALEINITAPTEGATQYLTSITIANQSGVTSGREALAGTTIYDITSLDDAEWNEPSSTDVINGSAAVRITFQDADGNPLNIELEAGSGTTVKVPAFLRPVLSENYGLRVILNMREGVAVGANDTHTKSIPQGTLIERKFNTMAMGNIPCPPKFTYETWMANLPDDTYVSHISLPATHDAGTYPTDRSVADNAFAQTQYMDIEQQLNAGIRVLDFRPKYVDEGFNIAHGYITYENRSYDKVVSMAQTWLANHPTEFIIFMLKNEHGNDDTSMTGWQMNMRNKLLSVPSEYRIDTFNPAMTLGEVRGKILFWSRDYYYGTDGNTSDHNHGDWVGCKNDFGTDNNNYKSYSIVGASWDNYWQTNVYTSGETTALGSIMYISDHYKGAWLGSGTGIVSPDADTKQSCIDATLKAASDDTSNSTWYHLYLNVSGTDLGTGDYNNYTASKLNGMSTSTYQRAGVIFFDWATPAAGSGSLMITGDVNETHTVDYEDRGGYTVMKAIIDNNFKGGGPARSNKGE